MQIDWLTVVFEVINFGLLVLIALRFVFRPVREILARRKAEIDARARETETREAEAARVRANFEGELARIDSIADERVDAALAEARTSAERIVEEARRSATAELDKAETELVHARRRTLDRFRGEVLRLGTEAARRVVRELGDVEVGLAFARRAAHALDDAIGNGRLTGPIDVAHSPDLDADSLRELLQGLLGKLDLNLHVDDRLIAGVRLEAQGHEVEASASSSLDAWYESLTRAA